MFYYFYSYQDLISSTVASGYAVKLLKLVLDLFLLMRYVHYMIYFILHMILMCLASLAFRQLLSQEKDKEIQNGKI